MKFTDTNFDGLKVITGTKFDDPRGSFVKTFASSQLRDQKINFSCHELFYSISNKNVLRGMHFQLPPHALAKIVYVTTGSILDVVTDLRVDSATYMQSFSIELSSKNQQMLFIPKGFAHGFLAQENNTTTHYAQSDIHYPEFDTGILYNSLDFKWQVSDPILSQRDKNFCKLCDFFSPFTMTNCR